MLILFDELLWIVLSGILGLGLVIISFFYARLYKKTTTIIEDYQSQQQFSEILLGSNPLCCVIWKDSDDHPFYHSPHLMALLGFEDDHFSLDRLESALLAQDARIFEQTFQTLRKLNLPFTLYLKLNHNERTIFIKGTTVQLLNKELWVCLWISDDEGRYLQEKKLKQVLDRLSQQHDHLHGLFSQLPIPAWIRNSKLQIVQCNQAYVDAVEGGTVSQTIQQSKELISSPTSKNTRVLAQKAWASQEPQHQTSHVVIGGMRRLLDIHEIPVSTQSNEDISVGFALDLTSIEDMQAEIQRYVAAHEEVLQRLSTAISIFSSHGKLEFYNHAYLQLWNMEESWLNSGPTLSEILEKQRELRRLPEFADFPAYKKSQMKLFTTLIDPKEDIMHLPDGTTLRRMVSPHPLGGLIFTFEDITDTLNLERSFNTLKEVERETINNLHEGAAVFGSDGRIKLNNPSFAKMLALDEAELQQELHITVILDRIRSHLVHKGDWLDYKSLLSGMITERLAEKGRLETQDGKVIHYTSVPLPDGNILLSCFDVTDSIRAEQALLERNEALLMSDRIKTEFLENVSYELRTPLNSIIGFSELVLNEYFGTLNQKQKDYIEGILSASQKLRALINDVLDLASIESGRLHLRLKDISMVDFLKKFQENFSSVVQESGANLHLEIDPDMPYLRADAERLNQAFYNILKSSLEHVPAGGNILIRGTKVDNTVQIQFSEESNSPLHARSEVTDKPLVMRESHEGDQHPQDLDLKKQPSMRSKHLNVGLPLVKSIIGLHQGSISIENHPQTGTTVICQLPIRAQRKQPRFKNK